MEPLQNSTECQHTNTNSVEFMEYDWSLDREFYITRTVCLDCNKRIY